MEKDFSFWKKQINSALGESDAWRKSAKSLIKRFYDSTDRINLFYSNIQLLKSALINTTPRVEISRTNQSYNSENQDDNKLFDTAARIVQSVVNKSVADNSAIFIFKDLVENTCKTGRGVIWVEYEPVITQIPVQQNFIQKVASMVGIGNKYTERITDQKIKLVSLDSDEYLQSYGRYDRDIWWKARRHLMTRDQIAERFDYNASDGELNFSFKDSQTSQNMGEVWEIWDKHDKRRIYILMSSINSALLEDNEDPYKLDGFYPVWSYSPLTNDNGQPVPEFEIYRKLYEQIQGLSDKNAHLQKAIKYIQIIANKDTAKASEIIYAEDGAVISIEDFNPDIRQMISTLDITAASNLITINSQRINELKSEIWEITGIADIMRGVSDFRETATAQKIKGLYGGLRFKDRQEQIQAGIVNIIRILAELVCENWTADILMRESCIKLPTASEIQMADAIGNPISGPSIDQILEIIRSDKIRSSVISIETTASIFDSTAEQSANIQNLTNMVVKSLELSARTQDPADIKILQSLVKMNLATIKVSSNISSLLEQSLNQKMVAMAAAQNQPQATPGPSPDTAARIAMDSQKLQFEKQLEQQKLQNDYQIQMEKLAIEREKLSVKMEEIRAEQAANITRVEMGLAPDTNLG
jgi:hypothetical protein